MSKRTILDLDDPRLLERREGAVLLEGLESLHRKVDDDCLPKLRDVDAALLKIRLSTDLAGRVKLRRADAVAVAPADLRALSGDFTSSCHSESMLPYPTKRAI